MEASTHSIHIRPPPTTPLDESLAEAVQTLISAAAANHCGILVTRRSYELYTADVNAMVPFGLTREISEI